MEENGKPEKKPHQYLLFKYYANQFNFNHLSFPQFVTLLNTSNTLDAELFKRERKKKMEN